MRAGFADGGDCGIRGLEPGFGFQPLRLVHQSEDDVAVRLEMKRDAPPQIAERSGRNIGRSDRRTTISGVVVNIQHHMQTASGGVLNGIIKPFQFAGIELAAKRGL